jgi:hypothetical protein
VVGLNSEFQHFPIHLFALGLNPATAVFGDVEDFCNRLGRVGLDKQINVLYTR